MVRSCLAFKAVVNEEGGRTRAVVQLLEQMVQAIVDSLMSTLSAPGVNWRRGSCHSPLCARQPLLASSRMSSARTIGLSGLSEDSTLPLERDAGRGGSLDRARDSETAVTADW